MVWVGGCIYILYFSSVWLEEEGADLKKYIFLTSAAIVFLAPVKTRGFTSWRVKSRLERSVVEDFSQTRTFWRDYTKKKKDGATQFLISSNVYIFTIGSIRSLESSHVKKKARPITHQRDKSALTMKSAGSHKRIQFPPFTIHRLTHACIFICTFQFRLLIARYVFLRSVLMRRL